MTCGPDSSSLEERNNVENLNLSDLNLKKLKLTEEDALALSYLTPGLSRRIQKQLFASLPASEARKITRTLSMRTTDDNNDKVTTQLTPQRHSVDRISSTIASSSSSSNRQSKREEDNNQNASTTTNNNFIRTTLRDTSSSVLSPSSSSNLNNNERKFYIGSSLREPGDFKTAFHSSLKSTNTENNRELNSSSSFDPGKYATTMLAKAEQEQKPEAAKPARRISRFLRPDFFDPPKEDENVVVKEKKERERETQQVLKEIRDKRIKNRLNLRRERSLSKEPDNHCAKSTSENNDENQEKLIKCKELVEALKKVDTKEESTPKTTTEQITKLSHKNVQPSDTAHETEILFNNVSDNIKKIETNVLSLKEDVKKDRSSKLIRPKSYPAETLNHQSVEKQKSPEPSSSSSKISRIAKFRKQPSTANSSPPKDVAVAVPAEKVEKPKNKFLQSIEKKFEKLRTFSTEDKKTTPNEESSKKPSGGVGGGGVGGGVESTIKLLREQSEPKDVEPITESTLIKRAVSVEDFSNVKSKTLLQPSRKSVTKILGLFKKYEDKVKNDDAANVAVVNGTESTVLLPEISESNIPTISSKKPSVQREIMSPDRAERPKSLFFDRMKRYNGSRSDNSALVNVADNNNKRSSKLPVGNASRKSMNLDAPLTNGEDVSNNNTSTSSSDRKGLKLELRSKSTPEHQEDVVNLNRISYNSTDESSSTIFSPCDETLSCDSWSVCSDRTQDITSPLSPNGNAFSGDESESVIDRIRRKSFYTRFNEKKKPRKSFVGNYRDLDLYKDYNQKTTTVKYKPSSNNNNNNGQYTTNSLRRNNTSSEHEEYRPYVRSKSAGVGDYVNVPPRYQTYNPRRSNIASLYSNDDHRIVDDPLSTGTYRKYSYSPSTSRLGSLGRTSLSPSGDFQYVPHAHHVSSSSSSMRDNSFSSSISPTVENNNGITEHV